MLVEESENLRLVLKDYLKMMGFRVIDYGDGESAIRNYRRDYCDICLLDIGLSRKNEYFTIKELHTLSPELPVIFLSTKDSKEDRIKGFQAGCDDYLTKPFSAEELLLRIEAVLKRYRVNKKRENLKNDIVFNRGNITFNFSNLTLIYGEQIRILTKKEADLLKLLFEHKNKLIPREIFVNEIWGNSKAAMGRSMDVYISKLRSYLTYEPKIELANVHGIGYLLKISE